MHYFHKLSLASGLYLWTPLGDFRPQTPNLPTPGKNSAGAYALRMEYSQCSALDEAMRAWAFHPPNE